MKKILYFAVFIILSLNINAQKQLKTEKEGIKNNFSKILNSDGTLKIKQFKKESYNTDGYTLAYGKNGEPIFTRPFEQTAAGDENWDPNFANPGVQDNSQTVFGRSVTNLFIDSNIVYVGGSFDKAGGLAAKNIAKWDGAVWSKMGAGLSAHVSGIKKYGNDIFVTTSDGLFKWNGISWITVGLISGDINGNLFAGGMDIDSVGNVYVIGSFLNINGIAINGIAKWDGSSWSNFGAGLNYSQYYGSINSLVIKGSEIYLGGGFYNSQGVQVANIAKKNNNTPWTFVGGIINNQGGVGLTLLDGEFYISYGNLNPNPNGIYSVVLKKWDGVNWVQIGDLFNLGISSLVKFGNNLYASGSFTQCGNTAINKIAKWNGSAWVNAGNGFTMENANLAISSKFFLAGGYSDFVNQPNKDLKSISKWNGISWEQLTNGANNTVNCVTIDGNNVYIGGKFTEAGGLKVNKIAKWDGNKWDSMGPGLGGTTGQVKAIVVSGNKVYAGGSFTGNGYPYLAQWDGTTWSAVGSGVNYYVNALAAKNNDIYVGGSFNQAGAIVCNNIAKWNGSTWSALNYGTNGDVYCIAAGNDANIYVGGAFTSVGPLVDHVAKWNGTSWSPMGYGVDASVQTIAVNAANEVYIGGNFDIVNGGSVNNARGIAKWNGTSWNGLGSGLDISTNDVYSIAFNGSDVYVGGKFFLQGNSTGRSIAKWNGLNWNYLGSGIDKDSSSFGAVLGLATNNCNSLYAVGAFSSAGVNGAHRVAKYWINGVPSINIISSNLSNCGATPTTFNATILNGGTQPNYQWKINGVNVGNNSPTFISNSLNNGDEITCTLFGIGNCVGNPTISSNVLIMSINNSLVNNVSVTSSNNTVICSNTPTTFTATPTNGGTTPTYQWKVNNINVGTNSPTFTTSTLQNNDQVKVTMTSSLVCALPTSATSSTITMAVTPSPIANAGADTTICAGSSLQLNGSGGTTYAWSPSLGLNNSNIANPIATPTSNTMYVLTVSNGLCTSRDTINVNVAQPTTPTVSVSTANNNICSGSNTIFTAAATNAGNNPNYQWQVNGTNVGTNSATFTSSTLQNNNLVKVIVTSNGCSTSPTATSNSITVQVSTLVQPIVSLTTNILAVTNVDASATYTWQLLTNNQWNNVIPTATGITYTSTQAGEYRVKSEKGACTLFSASQVAARANNFDSTLLYIYLNPNPTRGLITIYKIVPSQNWQSLNIINAQGARVMPTINIKGLRNVTFNTSNLAPGLYFARLTNENGKKITYKFIKE